MFYSGSRIRIRSAVEEDAELLSLWVKDSEFASFQPLVWHVSDYREHWLWRQRTLRNVTPPLEYEVIVEDSDSASPLGLMQLSGVDRINQKAELSAYFARRRRTRSVFEALHAALHTVFDRLQLRKVICHYSPENLNVAKVLSSLGFTEEGLFRGELLDNQGRPRDLSRAALFRSQWVNPSGPRLKLQTIAPLSLHGFPE